MKDSLLSGLAAKIKNVDGKILGRDGKVMKPYCTVKFADHVEESSKNQSVGVEENFHGTIKAVMATLTPVSNVTDVPSSMTPYQPLNGNINSDRNASCVVDSQEAPKPSYASVFKTRNAPNIFELHNDEYVEGMSQFR